MIRGYHVYKTIWNAILGERLECRRDRDNEKDRFQNEVLVGHLPKKYSRVCAIFRGQIHCTVVGRRQYSSDLVQGGLEIPCCLLSHHLRLPYHKETVKIFVTCSHNYCFMIILSLLIFKRNFNDLHLKGSITIYQFTITITLC